MSKVTLSVLPDGYLKGNTTRQGPQHLVPSKGFTWTALCGVQVHGPSLMEAVYFPTEFCGECVKIAKIKP